MTLLIPTLAFVFVSLLIVAGALAFSPSGAVVIGRRLGELTGAGAPFKAPAERVTSSVFPLLGIEPLLGRVFTRQEDDTASAVTVISYALWKERFHSHANVLGTTIDLDRRPYTIIGVMPEGFDFPLRIAVQVRTPSGHMDFWAPLAAKAVQERVFPFFESGNQRHHGGER